MRATEGAAQSESGQDRVGFGVILGELFDAIDEALTISVRGEGLGVSRTEPEVGDDFGLIDQQLVIFLVYHCH